MKDILYDGSCDHDRNGEDGNDNDENGAPCMFKQGPVMCSNSPKESGNSCCNNYRSVTDALLMIVA